MLKNHEVTLLSVNAADVLSRSRDRPILVRGPWGETHRALREEAQQCGAFAWRGDAACCQDVGADSSQPQKQEQPRTHVGRGGQGMVTMTACPPRFIHNLIVFNLSLRSLLYRLIRVCY